jgi:hypothetical protein
MERLQRAHDVLVEPGVQPRVYGRQQRRIRIPRHGPGRGWVPFR